LKDSDYKKIDIVNMKNETVVTSTDFSLVDNRIILRGHDFPLIPRNSAVRVIGYMKDGILPMEGTVTLSIAKQLNIDVIAFDEKNERRSYLKVRTEAKAIVRKAFTGCKSRKCFTVNESIKLRDISLGGLCFFSDRTFLVKQRLCIDLHEIKEDLIVKVLILRKQKERGGSGFRYRYGCKFVSLDNIAQTYICEYVFKMELENYQRIVDKES